LANRDEEELREALSQEFYQASYKTLNYYQKNRIKYIVKYNTDDVPVHRIRRITGYLVGSVENFNNAKRAEVRDRVKHGTSANPK